MVTVVNEMADRLPGNYFEQALGGGHAGNGKSNTEFGLESGDRYSVADKVLTTWAEDTVHLSSVLDQSIVDGEDKPLSPMDLILLHVYCTIIPISVVSIYST
jgi:hypothetical protein